MPPTIEEIEKFIRERGSSVDAKKFFAYYSDRGWSNHGEPITDWRALMIKSWEPRERKKPTPAANMAAATPDVEQMDPRLVDCFRISQEQRRRRQEWEKRTGVGWFTEKGYAMRKGGPL